MQATSAKKPKPMPKGSISGDATTTTPSVVPVQSARLRGTSAAARALVARVSGITTSMSTRHLQRDARCRPGSPARTAGASRAAIRAARTAHRPGTGVQEGRVRAARSPARFARASARPVARRHGGRASGDAGCPACARRRARPSATSASSGSRDSAGAYRGDESLAVAAPRQRHGISLRLRGRARRPPGTLGPASGAGRGGLTGPRGVACGGAQHGAAPLVAFSWSDRRRFRAEPAGTR